MHQINIKKIGFGTIFYYIYKKNAQS
jgi:hypothetical protein